MAERISSAAPSRSTGKGFWSRAWSWAAFTPARSKESSSTLPMDWMWAATVTPSFSSNWMAMPPAMHSGAVSRPEKWPPPATSW